MRFVISPVLTAYATRAAFKFDIYDNLVATSVSDSYVISGSGVSTIDEAISILGRNKHNKVIIDDPDSGVLAPTLDDMVFLRSEYIRLYGNVNKAPFDEPLGV